MKYLYIIITFILFFSCKKDNIISSDCNNNCIEIPQSQSFYGYDYKYDSVLYISPCFNPNNGNEILYVEKNLASGVTKLIKYNLQTFEKENILEAEIYFQPSWANNDWIIFGLNDENIWKIKSNGDSLTQLTFIGSNFNPECNFNSNRIICSNTNQSCSFIYDFYGNPIDTLNITSTTTFDWNMYNKILIPINQGEYIYNYNTNEMLLYNQDLSFAGKCQWINKNEFVVGGVSGIYKTNIITNNTEFIKKCCNAWAYFSPDYSHQLDKVIWQKTEEKKIGENLIEVKRKIILMDTDGTNEEEIEIK